MRELKEYRDFQVLEAYIQQLGICGNHRTTVSRLESQLSEAYDRKSRQDEYLGEVEKELERRFGKDWMTKVQEHLDSQK